MALSSPDWIERHAVIRANGQARKASVLGCTYQMNEEQMLLIMQKYSISHTIDELPSSSDSSVDRLTTSKGLQLENLVYRKGSEVEIGTGRVEFWNQ